MITMFFIVLGVWAVLTSYRIGYHKGWDDATLVDATYFKVPVIPVEQELEKRLDKVFKDGYHKVPKSSLEGGK